MSNHFQVFHPNNLHLVATVARAGSMAAAARELNLVPSALTYRVRQIEEALDVLLFDRSARRAQLTPAGQELLHSGQHLLEEFDALAQRVKRVATGWEPQLTLASDVVISRATLLDLCEAFYALGTPTRLKLRDETLLGSWNSLLSGQADIALGLPADIPPQAGVRSAPLGPLLFVFVVSPTHPLAAWQEAITDTELLSHRIIAVADSSQRGPGMSVGLLPGQDTMTVPNMQQKIEALRRGLGCGYVPQAMVQADLDSGRLVQKTVARPERISHLAYAWREASPSPVHGTVPSQGRALRWWLEQLQSAHTRQALLERH